MKFDVLIIGTGHAGANAAMALRQRGFAGSIALAGAEADPPYERPPLSKEYLAGEKNFERLIMRPLDFWHERQIDLRLGHKAIAVDPDAHRVDFENGEILDYGALIWAAGGVPRPLACEGHDLRCVHSIRSRADVDALRGELPETRRVVVIGGGYIGLEAAAVLARLGKQVVVLEALDRVLARVAAEPVSRFYEAEHRAQGVDVRTGVAVECIESRDGGVSGVRLAGGEVLAADLVIVGIGITPAIEPLRDAGAAQGDGVHVDEYCRTSLPDIFAIGDGAAHVNAFARGRRLRLESVQNAHDQAVVAARMLCGDPSAYDAVPWFWSNQYDLKLQTVGLAVGHDEFVVRGDPKARSFSVVYLREGRVAALDCVNAVKDYVQGRRLVQEGSAPPKNRLADSAIPLKEL